MSLVTKVVFPIPPPTTNDLSSHQRTQLLRKAKKLEQIFGVTPRLLDDTLEPNDPIHIAFPRRPSQHRRTKTSFESIDSSSSTSSCETPSPRKRSLTSLEPFVRVDNSPTCSTSPVNLSNSHETWTRRSKGPVLRLFMKSPGLEMIENSPPPDNTSNPIPSRQSPNSDVSFTQCSAVPDDTSLGFSTTPNSYSITSLSSLRKQKMDRLRKKLGQDVPFNLVFPSSDTESERSITPILPSSVKECTVLLPPPTPRRREKSGRLSRARDSIVGCSSVHHAKRQSVPNRTLTSTPTKSQSSEPKRLSFIIESPNEQGCAQDVGQNYELEQGAEFRSEWSVSAGTDIKLWSTRKEYEGWHSIRPSKDSQLPPTTTTSYSVQPTPPKSVPSKTAPKKKPPSYRKPVPRLLE